MARNESSRAPIVPMATKQARSAPAATPPTAKSRIIETPVPCVPEQPAKKVEISPAALSVQTPPVTAEVESLLESDDAG